MCDIVMYNVLNVAKKEFDDLLNSRLVTITIALYVIIVFLILYSSYPGPLVAPDPVTHAYNPITSLLHSLTNNLCFIGSLIGIALGYASMSGEFDGRALNTLLVKPLYRDSIINGKLLGLFGFLSFIFSLVTAIFISAVSLFF